MPRSSWLLPVLGLVLTLGLAAQAPPPRQVALQPVVAARQLPMDRGAAAVWQSLMKLRTRASMLMVTAHPDDEDGGLLTALSRGQGARVALLTLNRGEGGQNLMSDDFYDALGLVRTQELLAADRYYGVQQYFTRVVDFGFSKTKEETLAQWGHERVLGDAVRIVRMVRPLVVTSVFVGGPSDGHGNHAVAGEVAQEVFNAAGDPTQFPGQIAAGLRPWNPLKVYARDPVRAFTPRGIYDSASQVYTPGRIFDYVHQQWINGPPSVTLQAEEGGYDPVLGASYLQVARQGLAEQKTQLAGIAVPDLGRSSTPYHLYASRVTTAATEHSFFDGIDTSVAGIASLAPPDAPATASLRAGLQQVSQDIDQAIAAFRPANPAAIAPLLARGLGATNQLLAQVAQAGFPADAQYNITHELRVKQAQFNDAICEALGLAFSARVSGSGRGGRGGPAPTFQVAIPGQRFQVEANFDNPSADPIELDSVALSNPAGQPAWAYAPLAAESPVSVANNAAHTVRFRVTVSNRAPFTQPYYARPNDEQPYYNLIDPQFLGLPTSPYPLAAWAHLRYHGVPLEMAQVVETVARSGNSGLVENPLVVAPAIAVSITPTIGIIPLPARSLKLTVTVHSNVKGPASGTVQLRLPPGWRSEPATAGFALQRDGADEPVTFTLHPGQVTTERYSITAVATYGGRAYEQGYHTAGYAGLRPYNLYSPATYTTRGVRVRVAPNVSVGYVAGTGDSVPQALADLGVNVHLLSDTDLATGNLAAYQVIVLGIRAYAARPELSSHNARLLDYVHNGGVLIVQFQTSEFDHDFGPYPYQLGGNGATVVDEHSPVQILAPDNPVLSRPNPITQADFQGWVEERGHGFMASWAPQYTPLVEMHDPQQKPQEGGLLYATYGRGVYVYEGLALYRQLADGVPGAFRIFANLLSLPDRGATGARP